MPARTKRITRGEKVIAFIHEYCRIPEGSSVGKPFRLEPFQQKFIRDIYDNPAGTSRAYLSIARKNGKSALIAAIALAHVIGPEARQNSQVVSGARSRDQAALVYKLAEKMIRLNPDLQRLTRCVPSGKMIIGLPMNVEYKALAAEAGTAHGLSPVLAILDEVGQVKGPSDAFVEAIETAQGAHEGPLLIAISTQAADDADLFSLWLDDALASNDPRIVCHLHSAPADCDLMDRQAWKAANPALGKFRSVEDMKDFAQQAVRLPSKESSFRWLFLNQRVEAEQPFVSKSVWASCGASATLPGDAPVYGGLDLSSTSDLTSLVLVSQSESGSWSVEPFFWLPSEGLADKARADRKPYDIWARQGHLLTTPGRSVDYDYIAYFLRGLFDRRPIKKIGFDRWQMKHLKAALLRNGFSEEEVEAHFEDFGQGFQSMSPALRALETELLNARVKHGNHPVLTMCAANAKVVFDPAGNRKLTKAKSSGRIDGMVAMAIAFGVAPLDESEAQSYLETAEMAFV